MLCWCSLSDMVTMFLQAFTPREAANCMMMDKGYCTAPLFSKTEGLKSVTRQWRSSLGHCYDVVETISAYKGGI